MHFAYKEEANEHRQDSTTKMTIEPVYGLRLRPRPYTSNTAMQFSHASSLQHNPNLHTPSWNQPLSGVVNHHHVQDYGGRRVMPVVSTRWNPTAEQLQALEEMYRRGTTTPSAQQIQQIAAKLRRFGKIEGKNVFYWFQNHKARDRQKKRSQLELLAKSHSDHQPTKSSGLHKRSSLETDHPKKLSTMSNFSTSSKYSDQPVHGAVDKKSRDDERERGQENAYPSFNFSTKNEHLESGIKGDQTLELFPIKSRNDLISSLKLEDRNDDSNIGTKLVPNQFFEFLPTKN